MTHISNFRPLHDKVFVEELDTGNQVTKGGIILRDDNMKDHGIHPRWCRVFAVGPEIEDIKVGEWLLVKHARWTNGMIVEDGDKETKIWGIEYPEAVLLACDTDPREHIHLKHHKAHGHTNHIRIL